MRQVASSSPPATTRASGSALKLLNHEGEFLTKDDGNAVLAMAEKEDFDYADVDHIGTYRQDDSFDDRHIEAVLALDLVDTEAIRKRGFRVVVDAINSVGGVILPKLLDRLGVGYTILNGEANGDFAHNPEPLEKNLGGIMGEVAAGGYDLGIVVDPDVDRRPSSRRMARCMARNIRSSAWPTTSSTT